MKSKFFILAAFVAVSLLACKNDAKTKANADTTTKTTSTEGKSCKYSVKAGDVKVNWTAFKTTKRVGVKGTFDDVEINTANGTPSLSTLMLATSFKINSKTVNSNNPGRDAKLVEFFFGRMTGSLAITGNVKSVTGNNERGEGIVSVKMNGVSWDTAFKYTVTNNVLTMTTNINTNNWNAQDAIASINKACEEKHKGEDGVSKTWPDVDVSVVVPLSVDCN